MPTIRTARLHRYDGADALDITRASGRGDGLALAPSWSILRPVLALRRAGALTDEAWSRYVEAYTAEMRASYRRERAAWERILGADRTLLCYCDDPARRHRTVAARLLVAASRGRAVFGGERGAIVAVLT